MLKLSVIVPDILVRRWLNFTQHVVTIPIFFCQVLAHFLMLVICRTLEHCISFTVSAFYIFLVDCQAGYQYIAGCQVKTKFLPEFRFFSSSRAIILHCCLLLIMLSQERFFCMFSFPFCLYNSTLSSCLWVRNKLMIELFKLNYHLLNMRTAFAPPPGHLLHTSYSIPVYIFIFIHIYSFNV